MDRKELEKIYNEAYRAVYWTAFSLLKNEDDAQDIVQDTFVALINSYDSIQDKSKIVPWLKKVAANKSLNRLTRTKTDNVEDEFFDTVETVPEDFLPDSLVESEETRKIIMDIINNSLSEEIRMTLILFYFDEMSTKEVAEALGIPEGTVSRRIHSAKKKIKKEVEKYEEENDTKLFMVVPFLTQLFEKEAEQVPFKPIPASLLNLSASTGAAEAAGSEIASQALKKGTEVMLKKIIITSVSVVLVGAATAGIIYFATRKDEKSDVKKRAGKNEENEITAIDPDTEDTGSNGEDPSGAKSTSDAAGAVGSTEASSEASAASTTEGSTEDTTAAPTETEEVESVYDLSGMSAEEIADLCDGLTTRKIPKVGDTLEDVQKTYFDVRPWRFTGATLLEGRYSKSDKSNVNVIFVSGVYNDGYPKNGGPHIDKVDYFGTGLVIDICDTELADEFIEIMKQRHPVIEQKPDGSWKSDDFVVGLTPVDFFDRSKGTHFQIAYGEKSNWYESVAGIFGFGYNITTGDPTEETTADSN